MLIKPQTLLFLPLFLFCQFVMAQDQISERVGYAYDVDTDELIYSENHLETFTNGSIISDKVTYRDAEGNIIAEKDVDYTDSIVMPDFNLKNHATGHTEIASKRDTELQVVFTPNEATEADSKTIPLPEQGIIDAGFDRYIIQNWSELIEGKQLVQKMLIPSLKQFIEFRIYQKEVNEESNKRVLKVDPKSVFIRLLADPLVLEYDFDEPRLLSYLGKSNMRDAKGDNLQVRIEFPQTEYKISQQ